MTAVFCDSAEDAVSISCGLMSEFSVFFGTGVTIELELVPTAVVGGVSVDTFEGLLFEDPEDGLTGVDPGVRGDR